jgi:iron complex transport system substrate-binding protein
MMRRKMRLCAAAVAAVVSVVLIAGCSSSDESDDGSTRSSAGSGQFPVTVTTKTGDVTIESKPERILTLGNPAFEDVIALGERPIAANVDKIDQLPYLAEYVNDKSLNPKLADVYANEVNVEVIAAQNPDLIVAPAWPQFTDPVILDKLKKIAPTLIFDMQDATGDWRTGVQQVAQALGQQDKGQELIDAAVAEYTKVGEAHPGLATKPYSFGLFMNGTISLASGGNVLGLFGLQPARDQAAVEEKGERIAYSEETVSLVEGQIVMLMPFPQAASQTMEDSPFWKGGLENRVIWLTDAQGEAINNAGILGKTWLPGDLDAELGKIAAPATTG